MTDTLNPSSTTPAPTELALIIPDRSTTIILLDNVTGPRTGPASMQAIDGEVAIVASGIISAPGIAIELFKGADWVSTPPALMVTSVGSYSFTADNATGIRARPLFDLSSPVIVVASF